MVLMHLFGAFLILVAYADYGTESNSVVQFEIILGLTFVLIGWVLGLMRGWVKSGLVVCNPRLLIQFHVFQLYRET